MEALQILSRSEMRNIKGGYMQESSVGKITLVLNGVCTGRVCCGNDTYNPDCYDIPCCSDFGNDVGWCN